jgi:hypothetical protein
MTTFEEDAVSLAWGSWVELGVSGWTRTHQDWAIDPEPLILLTAFLGDTDGRLQNEATDWCIRNWRSISKVRMRNFANRAPRDVRETYAVWAATVNEYAGSSWPLASTPRPSGLTGRSTAPDLTRPSTAWLRMRGILGTSARTEILRYLTSRAPVRVSAARLAAGTGYAKRIVSDECETLVATGLLSVHPAGNRHEFELRRRSALESLVSALPPVRPDWVPLVALTTTLVRAERALEASSERTAPVVAFDALVGIEGALDRLSLGDLWSRQGEGHVASFEAIGAATLGEWSTGEWDGPRFD